MSTSYLSSASKHEKDSLFRVLHSVVQPSEKITILNLLSKTCLTDDPLKALNFAEQALFISESINDDRGKAESKYYIARYYQSKNDYQKALNLLLESKEGFTKIEDDKWRAKTCLELGKIYQKRFKYEKALDYLFKAMEIFKDLKKEKKLAECYNIIGGIYYDEGYYEKSFEYFQNSLTIWERVGDDAGLASRYNNIGEIYRINLQFEDAIRYYKKAITINKKLNIENNLAINFDNMGNIYIVRKQYDSAFYYLSKSLEISERIDNAERVSMAEISLGNLYLRRNEINKARQHFEKGYRLAQKNSFLIFVKDAAKGLSEIFKEKKQFKDSYYYYKKYKQISDSIYSAKSSEKITQLEMKLIFEHEQELNSLKRQKSNIKYFLIAFGLVCLLVIIILLYGRMRIKSKHSIIKAKNLQLEKKQLEEEIDLKNRELATNVMYLVKKNEFINFISEKLYNSKLKFKKENQKIVEEIILDFQSSVDTDIWKDFEERFREVHKEFYNKMNQKFPNLSNNEKKLCALLRLNMTTKEVAAITHQNPHTIEVARTRLRKKLGLSNKETSLVSFLSNL